jgi:hypothetical protein
MMSAAHALLKSSVFDRCVCACVFCCAIAAWTSVSGSDECVCRSVGWCVRACVCTCICCCATGDNGKRQGNGIILPREINNL